MVEGGDFMPALILVAELSIFAAFCYVVLVGKMERVQAVVSVDDRLRLKFSGADDVKCGMEPQGGGIGHRFTRACLQRHETVLEASSDRLARDRTFACRCLFMTLEKCRAFHKST